MQIRNQKRAAVYIRLPAEYPEVTKQMGMKLRALRNYAARHGFEVAGEFVDIVNEGDDCRKLEEVLGLARSREIETILFWSFEEFAGTVKAFLSIIGELLRLGVSIVSYDEQIDTSGEGGDEILRAMLALGKFRSSFVTKRIMEGQRRAAAAGKSLTRPGLPKKVFDEIERLYKAGYNKNRIKVKLGVSYDTVWKHIKSMEQRQ